MFDEAQLEIILVSIAVLYTAPERLPQISGNDVAKILRRPLGLGQTQEGLLVANSNRDQIEVQIGANKLDVRDLSDGLEHAKDKIPEVVAGFLELLGGVEITSYGVNFIAEVANDSPDIWMAKKFLNDELSAQLSSPITCSSVAIRIDHPPKLVTVRFEAREDPPINVNWNASQQAETMPSNERISEDIENQFRELINILTMLDA